MAINEYDLDEVKRLKAEWRDPVTDALVDPTTVFFRLTRPDGVVCPTSLAPTPSSSRPGVGIYTVLWTMALEGIHHYRFVGTGWRRRPPRGAFYVEKNLAG